MSSAKAWLARIAEALERIAPPKAPEVDWQAHPAYVWTGSSARTVDPLEAPPLGLICGVDAQKAAVAENVARLARGAAAHDMLLWGARGMGKSALIRAAVRAAQAAYPGRIALVQAAPDESLAILLGTLRQTDRQFLILLDDLGFDADDASSARRLRSWLEGGVEARPANVRLAVTSNRRAIVERHMAEHMIPSIRVMWSMIGWPWQIASVSRSAFTLARKTITLRSSLAMQRTTGWNSRTKTR